MGTVDTVVNILYQTILNFFPQDFPSIGSAEYYISIIASVGRTIIFQSPNRLENLSSPQGETEMSPFSDLRNFLQRDCMEWYVKSVTFWEFLRIPEYLE